MSLNLEEKKADQQASQDKNKGSFVDFLVSLEQRVRNLEQALNLKSTST